MQNRYVGDIGDFGKLGLLRQLHKQELSVGVNWYLAPDEHHNNDGRYIGYLQNDRFRLCDENLWQALGEIVASGQRNVATLETADILPAEYYSKPLNFSHEVKPKRQQLRMEWHAAALDQLRKCDIVFVDPDNGLIVPSASGKPKSIKYAQPCELSDYYNIGASVIYYQHKARRPDSFYADQHKKLLASGNFLGAIGLGLKFVTTSQRYYFFIIQPSHREAISSCIEQMSASPWHEHFELLSERI